MAHNKHNVKFGWKPDVKDHRDKIMRFGAPSLVGVPETQDLRPVCSTVENQFTLGSCTANAAVGNLECLEIKAGIVSKDIENYSRLFPYYNMRDMMSNVNEDSGGTIRDMMKALAAYGVCDELKWPYDITKFNVKPTDECYVDAADHKIIEYHRLETFPDLIQCLAEGFPFAFGFMTYDGFMSEEVARTGILNLPNPTEVFMGGHAVCAVGYDLKARTVLVRNSWGAEWGQGGYFTMPFAYISNPNLAQDFWTIRR
jgi:C1A family cysteine protease